jgi:hypothetical protein
MGTGGAGVWVSVVTTVWAWDVVAALLCATWPWDAIVMFFSFFGVSSSISMRLASRRGF